MFFFSFLSSHTIQATSYYWLKMLGLLTAKVSISMVIEAWQNFSSNKSFEICFTSIFDVQVNVSYLSSGLFRACFLRCTVHFSEYSVACCRVQFWCQVQFFFLPTFCITQSSKHFCRSLNKFSICHETFFFYIPSRVLFHVVLCYFYAFFYYLMAFLLKSSTSSFFHF